MHNHCTREVLHAEMQLSTYFYKVLYLFRPEGLTPDSGDSKFAGDDSEAPVKSPQPARPRQAGGQEARVHPADAAAVEPAMLNQVEYFIIVGRPEPGQSRQQ
jgi:hypothetical protein